MEPSNNSGMYNLRYGCCRGRNTDAENDTLSDNPKKKQTKSVKTTLETTDKTKSNQDEQKEVDSESLIRTPDKIKTTTTVEAIAQDQRCSVVHGKETTTTVEAIAQDQKCSVVHGKETTTTVEAIAQD